MSTPVKVTVAGASGNLGVALLRNLLAFEQLRVRVLKRAGSAATFPGATDVVEVDFASPESLQAALQGQDAVVSVLAATASEEQLRLVDAAAAAGVKRFLPSEFGSDLSNPKTRALPVFALKVKAREHVEATAASTGLTYTYVVNAAFLDWGLAHHFLLDTSNSKPAIIDGGDVAFSATTLDSVGQAVIGVLTHPDATRNRTVYVHDLVVSQNRLLALAKKAAPGRPWEPVPTKLDDLTARADERLAQGLLDNETFFPYIFRSLFDPSCGANFTGKTDNELLGLPGKTEEDVFEILKGLLN